jgi:REP element-mobilizing transposase RayT
VLGEVEHASVVTESLNYFHGIRVWTGDYVVMPNHVHVLMTPMEAYQLEEILHSVKSYSAKRINKKTGQVGRLWQKESYDHIVRDADQLAAFQSYIRNNPAKANLKEGECTLSKDAIYDLFP